MAWAWVLFLLPLADALFVYRRIGAWLIHIVLEGASDDRKQKRLLIDVAVGIGLAVLIVLIVVLSTSTEPTFIYQAF